MHAQRGKKFLKCPSSEAIQLSPPPQNWDYRITPSHLDFYMASEAHTQVVMIALQALFQLTYLPSPSLQLWEEKKYTGTWKEWHWPRSTEKSSCLITVLWRGDVRQHQGPLTANSWVLICLATLPRADHTTVHLWGSLRITHSVLWGKHSEFLLCL